MLGKNATSNLVPVINKKEFDNEATEFLSKYFPVALNTPIAVPITMIAQEKMGLTILEHRLTEDFSVLGQMCFTSGATEIYDRDNDEYKMLEVKKGTMIIDPDTLTLRNFGCLNNTIAHESYHWYKHRNYHILRSILDDKQSVALRCPSYQKDEQYEKRWDDVDWMEWQANGIAPRILMPVQTVGAVFESLLEKSKQNLYVQYELTPAIQWVAERMADFYNVSRQSAKLRLIELGFITS